MLPRRAIAPQAATQTATRKHLLTVTRATEAAPPDVRGLDGGASPSSSAAVVPGKVTCSRIFLMSGDVTAQCHVQSGLACAANLDLNRPYRQHSGMRDASSCPTLHPAAGRRVSRNSKPTGSSPMRSMVLVLLPPPPPPPPPSMVCVDTALPPEVRAEGYRDDTSSTCGRHDTVPTSPTDCLRDRSR